MLRIAGSFRGISQAFKVVVDFYGWTHIVLVTDDNTASVCWYAAKPFEDVFDHDDDYSFTWIRFGASPTDEQLDDILQQIRSLTRGSFGVAITYLLTYLLTYLVARVRESDLLHLSSILHQLINYAELCTFYNWTSDPL